MRSEAILVSRHFTLYKDAQTTCLNLKRVPTSSAVCQRILELREKNILSILVTRSVIRRDSHRYRLDVFPIDKRNVARAIVYLS